MRTRPRAHLYQPLLHRSEIYRLFFFFPVRRKLSGKSKKWRSIFNLGRSVDSKGKLNRNGSVFIRSPGITGKVSRQDEWLQFASGRDFLFEDWFIDKIHTIIDLFVFLLLTTEKAALRPSRSMESLCSLPTGVAKTDMHEFDGINFSLLSHCVAVIVTGELMVLLIWPR